MSGSPLIRRMALRAFDFSERSVRWGKRSQQRRVERWRERLPFIVACAITASVAWAIATHLFSHDLALFAPIAAVITVGLNHGQRAARAIEIGVGVTVGVGLGTLFVTLFGVGTWQLVVLIAASMSFATWLGAGNLITIQAAVQGIVVMTLFHGDDQGLTRVLDAVIGSSCAIAASLIMPTASLHRPRRAAAKALTEAAGTIDAICRALRENDEDAGRDVLARARRSESLMEPLRETSRESLASARFSALLRHRRGHAEELAALVAPLDRLLRNLRIVARRCAVALWRHEAVPETHRELLAGIADVLRDCAQELEQGHVPREVRGRLIELAERSAEFEIDRSLSAVVLLAQARSMIIDVLELCGMDSADAREAVPDME
ncbi:FUSC family protein [Propioniferax innocua]|uniref:Uncharacterized membrane protein YgaE (UPF0421/DUF939 family) n=1 Tax=Propioniferax innocua TaxID=1753 RepID=A0A542ZB93_9ACTN|nr:FUSC family protein [Propioniferax innocua]TQL57617.1 uncharacterized membrane protein YgaE (UPF0421/DUF939 family) [Propioniferax innocua]